nr:hypothetical protein [uncultured Sphaerochaeta sp.]
MIKFLRNLFLPKDTPKIVTSRAAEIYVIIVNSIKEYYPKKSEIIGVEISIFLFFLADYIVTKKRKEAQLNTPWLFAAFGEMKEIILSEEPYLSEDLLADLLVQRIQLYNRIVENTNFEENFIPKVVESQTSLIANIIEENEISFYLPGPPDYEEFQIDYEPEIVSAITTILEHAYKLCLNDYIKMLRRFSRSTNCKRFDLLN